MLIDIISSSLLYRRLRCFLVRDRAKRLCGKVVSIRSERGLIEYAPFLLSALVKGSQTTFHTAT